MLVADRQGRIRHVTSVLATHLDTTIEILKVGSGGSDIFILRVIAVRAPLVRADTAGITLDVGRASLTSCMRCLAIIV